MWSEKTTIPKLLDELGRRTNKQKIFTKQSFTLLQVVERFFRPSQHVVFTRNRKAKQVQQIQLYFCSYKKCLPTQDCFSIDKMESENVQPSAQNITNMEIKWDTSNIKTSIILEQKARLVLTS